MHPIQIFSTYNTKQHTAVPFHFCPNCGKELRAEERGANGSVRCSQCRSAFYKNPFPGVTILVEDNGKVLLGKRHAHSFNGGKWCLPGGFIEWNEDFLTAAIRETKEETGLDVRIASIISVCTNYLSPNLHTLVVVLRAEMIGGALRAGDDIATVAWFSPTALPEMAFEADAHIIARYFANKFSGAPVDPEFADANPDS
ncbi:MAG: NUDIX domain-containing protein [Chloroflexi bacterium]|nr:NUDIX domain-containing protein [Chloroflexota bacterium]